MGSELHYFESIGSTSQHAAELAKANAPEGTLVVADEQTQGRGRGGRHWRTPRGCSLAMSLVLRPSPDKATGPGGTGLVGALAVVDALSTLAIESSIKWPNDVMIEGRKVAGVLAEASWSGDYLDYVVLGIGINVREGSIASDADLEYPATWIESVGGSRVDRIALLGEVVEGIDRWYPRLGRPDLLAAWEGKLAFRGERVNILAKGEWVAGLLMGLTQDGWLRLATQEGEILELEPGDHRLRPASMTTRGTHKQRMERGASH